MEGKKLPTERTVGKQHAPKRMKSQSKAVKLTTRREAESVGSFGLNEHWAPALTGERFGQLGTGRGRTQKKRCIGTGNEIEGLCRIPGD